MSERWSVADKKDALEIFREIVFALDTFQCISNGWLMQATCVVNRGERPHLLNFATNNPKYLFFVYTFELLLVMGLYLERLAG